MTCKSSRSFQTYAYQIFLTCGLALAPAACAAVRAQSATVVATSTPEAVAPAAAPADPTQARLTRARALAAAHKLAAAAAELEAIRNSTTDDSVREVTRIMLMGIHFEEADYARAQALLEEVFASRSAQNESATRSFFALAGQAVNGAREHLDRYKFFGINLGDRALPPEAASDLDRLRQMLERIAAQAREMTAGNAKATDAWALLEDVAGVRTSLARDAADRVQWQREVAGARQKLAASETRIATISSTAPSRMIPPQPPHNGMTTAPASAQNRRASGNSAEATRTNNAGQGASRPSAGNADAQPSRPAETARQQPSESERRAPEAAATVVSERAVESGSLLDRALQTVKPVYPQIARNQRIMGVVVVYLEVDETGVVIAVPRANGPALLRQAAMDAARRWRFRPTLVNGQPVRVNGFITFNFTL